MPTPEPLLRTAEGAPRHVRVAIIGSGFGGLCMAIKLLEAGERDFVVLERADAVGGTWRDNHYPGCECDVPSHLYSYSFELKPDWSAPYGRSQEIRAYIEHCTDKYAVRPHIAFEQALVDARFDAQAARWHCETHAGERFSADVVVSALGGLSNPMIPSLPGLDSFAGPTFHSASWQHGCDLRGKRVAVVGTGASTIQFLSHVARDAAQVTVFQRTPPWVLPKANTPFSERRKRLFRHFPLLARMERKRIFTRMELMGMAFRNPKWMEHPRREGKAHIARHIKDPALRRKLTPNYTPGCKRILLSNDYYPAMARDNVQLETSGIAEVTPDAILTGDGHRIEADVIIFGTGFDVHGRKQRHHIEGRDGAVLGKDGAGREAYLGTMVAGFPNFFLLAGPNAGLGHNSIIIILEGAVRQTMMALDHMRAQGARTLEVDAGAQARYNARVQDQLRTSVWNTGCDSWYLDEDGLNRTIWPGSAASYARATRELRPQDLLLG